MTTAEKLQTIAENEQKVYEAGIQAEYDNFWDNFQNYGARSSYSYGFNSSCWNDKIFKPKYDLVTGYDGATRMFERTGITDLRGILEKCGVTLNVANGGNMTNMFANSAVTRLPTIDISKIKAIYGVFYGCKNLISIQKIIVKDSAPNYLATNMFYNCTALEEFELEGQIFESISFEYSPLNTATIVNVIECLSEGVNVTKQTLTLKQTAADNMTFPYTSPHSGITYNSWDELIATKQNWTIALSA